MMTPLRLEMQMLLWEDFYPQQQTRVLHLIALEVFFIQTIPFLFRHANRVWQGVISEGRRSERPLHIISVYAAFAVEPAQKMEQITALFPGIKTMLESSFQSPLYSSCLLVQTCFYQHCKRFSHVGIQITVKCNYIRLQSKHENTYSPVIFCLFTLASCAEFLKHNKVLLITRKALNLMTPSSTTRQVIKL